MENNLIIFDNLSVDNLNNNLVEKLFYNSRHFNSLCIFIFESASHNLGYIKHNIHNGLNYNYLFVLIQDYQ